MRPISKISLFGIRLAALLLAVYWMVIFVGTHLPARSPLPAGFEAVNDKSKHFLAYFLLATMMCYTTTSERWVRRFGTIGLVGLAYAAFDEWTQQFVAGRVTDLNDFVADAAGIGSAIAIYVLAKLCFRQWQGSGGTV